MESLRELVETVIAVVVAMGSIQAFLENRRRARIKELLEEIDGHAQKRAEHYVTKLKNELRDEMDQVAAKRDAQLRQDIADSLAGRS